VTAPPVPRSQGRFRADIEGLRAVAVLMVLLYHAGVPWAGGGFAGVDVFFVISGFLITGLLVAEGRREGRIDLVGFWARRARRLLPASALVLAVTALLTVLVLPAVRWRETGWDILTSGLYVVNWRLAARSVDYLAEDSAPSPVQHYWSLAVEEQFYLLWPLLVVVALLAARRRQARLEVVLAALLVGFVVLPSFLWSLHLTGTDPAVAYFVTTTRIWQLGVGALVALALTRLERLPGVAAAVLSWTGLVAIVVGLLTQGTHSAWPGDAALVPTLGAVAVIAGGSARTAPGWAPLRLLSWAPLQATGALSYSLYLWHWPLLVLAAARWGELSVTAGLLVVGLSAVPAWLGHRYVEEPVRRSRALARRPSRALGVGVLCTLLSVAAGAALVQTVDRQVRLSERADGEAEGARALATRAPDVDAPSDDPAGPVGDVSGTAGAPGPSRVPFDPSPVRITPDPLAATADVPALYADDCDGEVAGEVVRCDYGDPEGGLVLALVGDSKIAQWADALDRIGRDQGWQVRVYYRSACAWTTARLAGDGPTSSACQEWGEEVTQRLLGPERPDVVVVSAVQSRAHPPDGSGEATPEAMTAGLVRRWTQVGEAGIPVVAVADSPQPGGQQVYACVAEHRDDLSVCTVPPNDGSGTAPLREAVQQVPTAAFVTMNDWICPGDGECPPVVGGVLVYRQGSHITNTYAISLAPVLQARLESAFGTLGVQRPGAGLAG
jgi:peptidoglycan/LPS O-acetylase OafA/YrhL